MGKPAPQPLEDDQPRLSMRFVEWLMGLPDGWVTGVAGVSFTGQQEMLGNGAVPLQAEFALRSLVESW